MVSGHNFSALQGAHIRYCDISSMLLNSTVLHVLWTYQYIHCVCHVDIYCMPIFLL